MVKAIPKDAMIKESGTGKKIFIVLGIIGLIIVVLIALVIFGVMFTASNNFSRSGNVAVIPLHGVIVTEDMPGLFGSSYIASPKIIEKIKQANEDNSVKAIVLDINSPGGSAVASDEIALALKQANKTTVALIREVGASGGYWIASAADHIVANRMSITGSIGVIASYLQFTGLMDKYGVTYERMVAGKHKDLGSPFKELTEEERALFQVSLDKIHNYFIEEVAHNRNMDAAKVRELATGRIFLGVEAYEIGLVDELGNKDTVKKYLEQKLGTTVEFVEMKDQLSFFQLLAQASLQRSFYLGKGIGSMLLEEGELSIKT